MYTLILWIEYMIRKTNVWNKEWYTLEEFVQRTYIARKPDFAIAILADIMVIVIVCIIAIAVIRIKETKSSSKAKP